jgi:hypothetical protein
MVVSVNWRTAASLRRKKLIKRITVDGWIAIFSRTTATGPTDQAVTKLLVRRHH